MNLGMISNRTKPRVYIEPYLGCQKCHPWPYSERQWCVLYPGGNNWSTMGCATYQNDTRFDTWEEAMEAANSWRPPVMMNQTSPNTFTYTHTLPWINRHKWG